MSPLATANAIDFSPLAAGDLHLIPMLLQAAIFEASAFGHVDDPDALLAALRPSFDQVRQVAKLTHERMEEAERRVEEADRHVAERRSYYDREVDRAIDQMSSALVDLQVVALDAAFDPHGCFVYCLWGMDTRRPLYVGKSTNILNRLGSHMGERSKRSSVERVTLMRCKSERQMDMAEGQLIARYRPPWNTQGIRSDQVAPVPSPRRGGGTSATRPRARSSA